MKIGNMKEKTELGRKKFILIIRAAALKNA